MGVEIASRGEQALADSHIRWKLVLACVVATLAVMLVAGCLRKPGHQSSTLTYKLPTKISVPVGSNIPGTDIQYVKQSEDGARVTIGGQSALKRKGDSLDWSGSPMDGVTVDLKLRVAWHTEEELHLVGTAKIVIEDASPRTAPIVKTSAIKYVGPVAYGVGKKAAIPGSPVTYEGATDEGARLGGLEEYPYRKTGDSLLWEGILRDGVYARLDVRVLQFDAKGMRVGGLVTLWLGS